MDGYRALEVLRFFSFFPPRQTEHSQIVLKSAFSSGRFNSVALWTCWLCGSWFQSSGLMILNFSSRHAEAVRLIGWWQMWFVLWQWWVLSLVWSITDRKNLKSVFFYILGTVEDSHCHVVFVWTGLFHPGDTEESLISHLVYFGVLAWQTYLHVSVHI